MKKIISIIVVCCCILVWSTTPAQAAVCGDAVPTSESELRAYLNDCDSKLKNLSGQKQTLSQAMSVLTTQIALTQAKIAAQSQLLEQLEIEILDLSGKIQSLDYSLTDLTKLFVARVRGSYMSASRIPLAVIFESTGLPQFVKSLEYIEAVRDHDRNVLISLEKSRLDYDTQKTLKEKKQTEIEVVKKNLDREKAALTTQVSAKNKLLEETKNDEKRYQALRQEAQNRVAQLANYSASRGGSSLLSGTTKCDDWGCYYNQRDSSWGNQLIGNSNMTMASVGCLVTSAAMIASHYGKNLTPRDVAASAAPFEYDTADMRFSWLESVNGAKVTRSPQGCSGSSCLSIIDSELSANRPVIARITAANVAGTHFIVITKKEGDNYIMKDPYEADGNNVPFTSKHSISALSRVDRVSVN
jgi:peptidoglycan hydrolase CwlO-like protein